MKTYTKTKVAYVAIPIVLVICGISLFIWYSRLSGQSTIKPVAGAERLSSEPHTNRTVSKKSVSPGNVSGLPKERKDTAQSSEAIAMVALQEKENEPKESGIVEKAGNAAESDDAEKYRRREEQIRKKTSDEARSGIPILVQQWEEVVRHKNALGAREQRTESENQEFDRLTLERVEIENQIVHLATNYHATHPEEGAVYYPEGWIGQLLKQVGILWPKQ